MKICIVCGFDGLKNNSYELVGTEYVPTYEICPCCGFEHGTDLLGDYLDRWMNQGAKWYDDTQKPPNWELKVQLSNLDQIAVKKIVDKVTKYEKTQAYKLQAYKVASKRLINLLNSIPFLYHLYERTNDIEANYAKGYLKFVVTNGIGNCIQNDDHLTLGIIINKLVDIITFKEYALLYQTIFEWYQSLPSDYKKHSLEVCPKFGDLLTAGA